MKTFNFVYIDFKDKSEDNKILQIKNENVLIPVTVWNDLKRDFYFYELIEALEDRQDLLGCQTGSYWISWFQGIRIQTHGSHKQCIKFFIQQEY